MSKYVPKWAVYNLLLSKKPFRTAAMMLPVVNGSPANWDNLYTALKEAEKLWESVYCDNKKIITFDLQLHIKAVRLQKNIDVKSSFVFYVSCFELHVVFCMLKVIGKVINGSCLDQAFEETGKQTIIYVVS